jgi:hypothetical protein
MKILVEYDKKFYYWVDTVVMHDEYEYPCAVLISSSGIPFTISMALIKVVDDTYNCEKQMQKMIEKLKYDSYQLQQQTELDAQINRLITGNKETNE